MRPVASSADATASIAQREGVSGYVGDGSNRWPAAHRLGGFIGADSPAGSARTRELLGWQPTHPGLRDDLEAGYYFRTPEA